MVSVPQIIDRKRRGQRLTRSELESIVLGYTRGEVPDYQVAAWLMAVCTQGMALDETIDLTSVMAESGQQLDLSKLGTVVADKHSTGGVGDKTSLVVVPLVAACGVPVAKMSGRALGFTGGTLDKLESIPGLTVDHSVDRFVKQVREHGLAIVGQSPELAPADGKLYALRDVTATVESLPLVASSIMSKKLAAGAHVIVLDVKVGSGAFMPTLPEALELAETMVRIGRAAGRRTAAVVSDMSQPLGSAVGNTLEVVEAIAALRGEGPPDLTVLAVALTAEILVQAGRAAELAEGERLARAALSGGQALETFARLVAAQGGQARTVYQPELLPTAPLRQEVLAQEDGTVRTVDARAIARAAGALGASRERKEAAIDPTVGVLLHRKLGQRVTRGQSLATVFGSNPAHIAEAVRLVELAYEIGAETAPPPLIHWRSA